MDKVKLSALHQLRQSGQLIPVFPSNHLSVKPKTFGNLIDNRPISSALNPEYVQIISQCRDNLTKTDVGLCADDSMEVKSQLELSLDNIAQLDQDRLDTESTGARSTLNSKNQRDTVRSEHSGDSIKAAELDKLIEGFEDLGLDQDYLDFKDLVK